MTRRRFVDASAACAVTALIITLPRVSAQTQAQVPNLFEGLETVAGPKTVVLVSAGFGVGPGVEGQVRNTVRAAARAGARVYAIDPLGLQRVVRALDAITADAGVCYLLGVVGR